MAKYFLFLVIASVAGAAQAHEYVCTINNLTRMISVEHEIEGQELPCSVKYEKPDQGTVEYPWRADNKEGYCEEKADELANRLVGFGYTCERTDDEAMMEAGETEAP